MKFLLLCSVFLTNILLAEYTANKNSLSNTNFNNLGSIGINKPVVPTAPAQLIKEEIKKEEKKEITK